MCYSPEKLEKQEESFSKIQRAGATGSPNRHFLGLDCGAGHLRWPMEVRVHKRKHGHFSGGQLIGQTTAY